MLLIDNNTSVCPENRTVLKGNFPKEGTDLPGESHGQRSLAGYSTCGLKELDTTERLTLLLSELTVKPIYRGGTGGSER